MTESSPFSPLARRDFLQRCGFGLGSIALSSIMSQEGLIAAENSSNPLAPKPPKFKPKAKAVIQLFMAGGPSHLELFDYKPKLQQINGQFVPKSYLEGQRFAFLRPDAKLLGTRRKFKKHGQCGMEFSEVLPHMATLADDITMIRTMKTDNFNHGPAKLMAQTGFTTFGKPSFGAWTTYGLGSVSQDLPGFVVLQSGPRGPRGGSYLWSNGFLSSSYQGVPLRSKGDPILNLGNPKGIARNRQGRTVDTIAQLNALRRAETGDEEIAARTASYEMAFRMQQSAPDLVDISSETAKTLADYGVKQGQSSFAYNCLLARRLVERGVRFVTLFHTEWDHHGGLENLEGAFDEVCRQVDRPSAALVKDLKQRGMLDETLVTWGGEFGRTPMGEERRPVGRDHHIETFSMWLAGGGVKAGQTIGETDELGFFPTDLEQRVHFHDLHATLLHLLGMDHHKLTHRFQGLDFRLTGTAGKLVKQLLA